MSEKGYEACSGSNEGDDSATLRGLGPAPVRHEAPGLYVKCEDVSHNVRCDGASGFNRLLDAYFTGLEHRRKGHHTCFQVTKMIFDALCSCCDPKPLARAEAIVP